MYVFFMRVQIEMSVTKIDVYFGYTQLMRFFYFISQAIIMPNIEGSPPDPFLGFKISAKPRQPGVETPGYYLSSLKGLKVFYLKDLL